MTCQSTALTPGSVTAPPVLSSSKFTPQSQEESSWMAAVSFIALSGYSARRCRHRVFVGFYVFHVAAARTGYTYKNVLLLHDIAQRADPAFQSVLKQIALKSINTDWPPSQRTLCVSCSSYNPGKNYTLPCPGPPLLLTENSTLPNTDII